MSSKQSRGWRDSSDRKVSPVEAACVVESYLIEQNFTKTLAEFRGEAASLFSTLKNGRPKSVKSLSSILHDYVVIREENKASKQVNAKLEQAVKDEKMVVLQERNRIQMLVQKINESIAIYQGACLPLSSPAHLPVSTTPSQQPIPILPVGHTTPPGIGTGPGLSRTPSSARNLTATPATTNKRKNSVTNKLSHAASLSDNATQNTAAKKKARQNVLPSASPPDAQPSPPWPMCGTVRKNSLNMVRTVQSKSPRPLQHQTSHDPKQLFSTPYTPAPPPPPQLPPSRSSLPTSKSLPADAHARPLAPQKRLQDPIPAPAPARTKSNISSPTTRAEDPSHPDLKTPSPRASASQPSENLLPENRCSTDDSHSQAPKEDAAEGNKAKKSKASDQPALDNQTASQGHGEDGCLKISDAGEKICETAEAATQGRTSPDSRTCVGTRGMKPSKTMRPLDFSSKNLSSEETSLLPMNFLNHERSSDSQASLANPISPVSPRNDSPAPSSVSDMDCVILDGEEESMPQLCADLESIDDILACLDDASFSELVGDMLTNDVCSVDALPSSETDKNRSLIGEDSFGFHCIVDRVNSQEGSSPQLGNVLSARDVNATSHISLTSKSPTSPSKRSPVRSGIEAEKSTILDKENVLITESSQ